MSYNTKNYTEQSGDVTRIGGKLIIEEGAEVIGLPSGDGGGSKLPVAANQKDSTADDVSTLVGDFNALLAKLKAAGLMTADSE